ncbi:LamG domain-containing protein [Flexithrix dorotheae]|uniref:LamG domain-containing protein n=1 Tax=Flexithrix dorotheae TaxID=70993 RepID=UPI00037F3AD0|nr:LamG-like jellyroll fold domain-containing protein [Flexithrix dorotheae]
MKCQYHHKIHTPLFLLFFLLLIQDKMLFAQNYLDDYSFLVEEIRQAGPEETIGYQMALFGETSQLNEERLKGIKAFLEKDEKRLVCLILKDKATGFYEKLKKYKLQTHLFSPEKADPLLGIALDGKSRLFVFAEQHPKFLNASNYLRYFRLEENKFIPEEKEGKITNDLSFISLPAPFEGNFEQLFFDFIDQTGKLPNFVFTAEKENISQILNDINQENWFRAIVAEKDRKLENVSWNELPELTSSGKIHVSQTRISPHKRGYRFSPDVMNFNNLNSNVVKLFRASKFRLFDHLQYHFDFDENLTNKANPDQQLLYSYIEFETDEERGKYASFNGEGHYIDYGIPSSLSMEEITISAWIKPANLIGGRSIVGMGEVFSAKVFDGYLHFTTPDIKDHINDASVVKGDTWQHVAYVYMANKEVLFYYNGKLAGRLPASEITVSPQSLLIGTNLWDEYFEGGLDDLLIWNRALSDLEIREIYENIDSLNEAQSDSKSLLWLFSALFFISGGILYLIKKKKPGEEKKSAFPTSNKNSKEVLNFDSIKKTIPACGVFLFGGFKLINKNGKELTALFSPKRRELFVLLLLFTIKNKGITSKKMSDILWAGHSFEGAKNNRSTQIKRLREILAQNTGISITYDDKLWKIIFEKNVYCDLADYWEAKANYLQQPQPEIRKNILKAMLEIPQVGLLSPNMQYDWLDKFKSQLTEELLEILIPTLNENQLGLNKTDLLKLTNIIFTLDPLNEAALEHKIRLLIEEGKHTLAKTTFEQYEHLYFKYYNEKFPGRFSEFV